jgi:rhodanese-related sulfurtransferase
MKRLFAIIMILFSVEILAVTPKEAYSLAQVGKAVLIDVREQDEIKEGMVQGARWFPLSKIKSDQNWEEDFIKMIEGKKVFLYCRSGSRSSQVQTMLKKQGINAENIGGMLTLKDELPIRKP